jgi:C4-dicarboxylate-specific signal transduction histidine kinase
VELFDSVAENVLQNAVAKRRSSPGLTIAATLAWDDGPTLSVCDSGAAIPAPLAQQLFVSPVVSTQGLGVGLYQAARLATSSGYRLLLDSNVPGKVCLVLRKAAEPGGLTAGDRPPPAD